MIQTEVVWNLPVDPVILDAVLAKAQELIDQGKQAATPLVFVQGNKQYTARWWTDEPTAIGWVDFCEPYGPFSAAVINNG